MAGITKDDLRREITAIFKDADLTSMSAKKLRQQLEKKLDIDLSERKKEVDDIMMECLQEKRDGKSPKSESKKRKDADDDDEEEEEEEDEEDDEEEEKAKRSASKKKPPAKKQKKGSSDESDEGSDDNASDEEYSPAGKKGKGGGGRKGAKGGKKKAKGSDSDEGSDEDWAKSRRGGGGGGGGNSTPAKKAAKGKRGGGGGGGAYTRAYNLTPELAALVGSEAMARHEVVKKIWAIIKGRNLFDPKNKQFAICDDELLKVFGVKRFRTFGMMKYLKNHFVD
ncbi:upstream activation factor subunit spp27 [Ischnura elegans]|uniref:upstream activation factor subunit spp27 n=1 Tax=Ischnura elegans TaxID=197161 RepID=UPI001ED88FCC|nr:upstream activation factor subunit spp27 [Ischnura elegans]